jgi:hypothetical protein
MSAPGLVGHVRSITVFESMIPLPSHLFGAISGTATDTTMSYDGLVYFFTNY